MTILRPIKENELNMIMNWRMMPEITKYMYTDPVLTEESQKKWFDSLKTRKDIITFMIEVDSVPCGILNITDIDYTNKRCSWGYYIAIKEKRSLSLAMALEWNLYDYVFNVLNMNKLVGEIFSFNKAIIRIHQMCGSEIEGVLKQHIYKNGEFFDVTVTSILKENWNELKNKHPYERIVFFNE
ncbi:MAG: UDP-4-amino-4,6-dideoxy-N-acetyl-beta-L-altrosamine N-acetyltransferase [Lachnospiraceae bacterium]